jgi:hypothetical protein
LVPTVFLHGGVRRALSAIIIRSRHRPSPAALVSGQDFGTHFLKGVPDAWQLYRVAHLTRIGAAF